MRTLPLSLSPSHFLFIPLVLSLRVPRGWKVRGVSRNPTSGNVDKPETFQRDERNLPPLLFLSSCSPFPLSRRVMRARARVLVNLL